MHMLMGNICLLLFQYLLVASFCNFPGEGTYSRIFECRNWSTILNVLDVILNRAE